MQLSKNDLSQAWVLMGQIAFNQNMPNNYPSINVFEYTCGESTLGDTTMMGWSDDDMDYRNYHNKIWYCIPYDEWVDNHWDNYQTQATAKTSGTTTIGEYTRYFYIDGGRIIYNHQLTYTANSSTYSGFYNRTDGSTTEYVVYNESGTTKTGANGNKYTYYSRDYYRNFINITWYCVPIFQPHKEMFNSLRDLGQTWTLMGQIAFNQNMPNNYQSINVFQYTYGEYTDGCPTMRWDDDPMDYRNYHIYYMVLCTILLLG